MKFEDKRVRICFLVALFLMVIYQLFKETNIIPYQILDIVQGLALGMLIGGLLLSSCYGSKIKEFKKHLMK